MLVDLNKIGKLNDFKLLPYVPTPPPQQVLGRVLAVLDRLSPP
jgi:hypothetical protein